MRRFPSASTGLAGHLSGLWRAQCVAAAYRQSYLHPLTGPPPTRPCGAGYASSLPYTGILSGIRAERNADPRLVADRQKTLAVMACGGDEETVGVRPLVGDVPGVVRKFLKDEIRGRRRNPQACRRRHSAERLCGAMSISRKIQLWSLCLARRSHKHDRVFLAPCHADRFR